MKNPKENVIKVFEDVDNILKCEKTDWYSISWNWQKNWNSEKIKEFNFAIDFQIKDKEIIYFSGYTFTRINFNNIYKNKKLFFEDCKFEWGILFTWIDIKSIEIKNCLFNDFIFIDTNIDEINISNNNFNWKFVISSKNTIINKIILTNNTFIQDFTIENTEINLWFFEKNIFSWNDNKFLNIIFWWTKFKDIEFNNFIFENIRCNDDLIYFSENISFNSNVIFRRVKLDWISFLWANIENINFDYEDYYWLKIDWRNVLFDEWIIYNYKKYYEKDLSIEDTSILNKYLHYVIDNIEYNKFIKIENLYCQLKSNFENKKLRQVAWEFHIWEMEMKYKSLRYKSFGFGNKFINKFILWFYRFFALYWESVWRPLLWILAMLILSITTIYILDFDGNFEWWFWDIFLSILRTIFFQKDDNFSNFSIWLKYIISIIQILSPIFLFLLALAIKRKIKR